MVPTLKPSLSESRSKKEGHYGASRDNSTICTHSVPLRGDISICAKVTRSPNWCIVEEGQVSSFLQQSVGQLVHTYEETKPSCSSNLVKFPSIAICANNLPYVSVTPSGHINVDVEKMLEKKTQLFREFNTSFVNNSKYLFIPVYFHSC